MGTRYEASILRYKPADDITRYVSDWLLRHISKLDNSPHIEIEAKLGILLDKRSSQRLFISSVETEAVISQNEMRFIRFQSDMTIDQHGNFNRLLNKAVADLKGAVKYTHRYEVDTFYPPSRGEADRVRVSVDKKTDEVIATIQKKRIADLNVYNPSSKLDYRISLNMEVPAEMPYSDQDAIYSRDKDRMSYVYQAVQIDLTQVTDSIKNEKVHELEVELASSETLLREKEKLDNRQPNQFQEIVGVLLNNVRVLAKEANKFQR
ncbi:CYTH-like domain-containing protein [Chytriomyces cf. hyalinus JEL632]|nr:CYTH-like domain-containing protein [Chytriomyces cf. hyalinus JEL632]